MKKYDMSEYNCLRAELVSKQEKKNDVWLHMYILFLTLFTLSFQVNRNLFLLNYVVLITYQGRINNLEWNVSRISAYIRIYYESRHPLMKWETFNTQHEPYKKFLKKEMSGVWGIIRNTGASQLGILATSSYVITSIRANLEANKPFYGDILGFVLLELSVVLLIIVMCMNIHGKRKCEEELSKIMEDFKKECDNKLASRKLKPKR